MILGIYEHEPSFPAQALHESAVRTIMHGAIFDHIGALDIDEAASKLNLYKHANAHRLRVEQDGFIFNGARIPTDTHAISLMLMGALVMGADETTPYISDGVDYGDFSGATVLAMAQALKDFIKQTFVTLRQVHGDIRSGTITTTQQIEEAFTA